MNDENFSLKEVLREVRNDNKTALVTQSSILTTLGNIDKHLEKLNSKVAHHESKMSLLESVFTDVKSIQEKQDGFSSFQTKVMTVWALATFVIITVFNKII